MMNNDVQHSLKPLVQRIDPGSSLVRAWKLAGGVSAQVTALEILRPHGEKRKLIVRQHGETDRKRNPHIAADEYKLLQRLKSAGLPVPTPYDFDLSGEMLGAPFLVMEYIEGEPDFTPSNRWDFNRQLARTLATIHHVDVSSLAFLPDQEALFSQMITHRSTHPSSTEEQALKVLKTAWPLPKLNQPALLHGDFWPGNVLWKKGRLAAVIDWEDAAIGDPLTDLANARLEILVAFGEEAMEQFTFAYRSFLPKLDFTTLPYWDLAAALRLLPAIAQFGLDKDKEDAMREKVRWFVKQAMARMC